MDRELTVHRVDNGYVIAYPTGEIKKTKHMFFGEINYDVTGVRFCSTAEEVGQTITAMLKLSKRKKEAPIQAVTPGSMVDD